MFFTSAEVCLHGQKASAVLYTSNGNYIYSSSHDRDLVLEYEFSAKSGEKRQLTWLFSTLVAQNLALMPFATVAGFGSAATILAAHVSSCVGGPGQLMCIRHYVVAVAYAQNLKPQMTSCT